MFVITLFSAVIIIHHTIQDTNLDGTSVQFLNENRVIL